MAAGGPAAACDERAVLDVVSPAACSELLLVARCCGAVGYRANHCAATLFDIASLRPAWLVPVVEARERVRAAAEAALGQPLLVEFTGLTSWRPGSCIEWHHDSNREYLVQRQYAAVLYLNTAGADFQGGTFEFRAGEPAHVAARPGRCVIYPAHDVHRVTRVTSGERFTLTLWFTTQPAHDEDAKLLRTLRAAETAPALPPPASMFELPDGVDVRLCRLAQMGLGLAARRQVGGAYCLLHSLEEAGQGGVYVALHGPTFSEWNGRGGEDLEPAGAVLLPELGCFEDAWQALCGLQAWACNHRCGAWGAEAVCCRHLSDGGGGAHCGWLHAQQAGLCTSERRAPDGMFPALQHYLASLDGATAEWERLRAHWLELKAVVPRCPFSFD